MFRKKRGEERKEKEGDKVNSRRGGDVVKRRSQVGEAVKRRGGDKVDGRRGRE